MDVQVKCGCGSIFMASERFVGQRICCPTCGQPGLVPPPRRLLAEGVDIATDDDVTYEPCLGCGEVSTINGQLCSDCAYEARTGRKRRRFVMPWHVAAKFALVAGAVVVVAVVWAMIWVGTRPDPSVSTPEPVPVADPSHGLAGDSTGFGVHSALP